LAGVKYPKCEQTYLFSGRVRDTIDHVVELIPHSLGCNTGGSGTEVLLIGTSYEEDAKKVNGKVESSKEKISSANERAPVIEMGIP